MATQEIIRIGKCIYCGTSDGKLTKEHALPFGLSGDLVLHEASCEKCARITSAFEMSCLRGLLARTRAKLNLQSRHPKPVTTVFKIDHGFGWEKTELDAKQFAGMNILPLFEPPAFLSGGRVGGQVKIRGWDTLNLGSPLPQLPHLAKKSKVVYQYDIDLHVWAFARMLAKIGYCCAVAHLGLDKISDAYVLPSILKQKDDVQTWVMVRFRVDENVRITPHIQNCSPLTDWIKSGFCEQDVGKCSKK
jgi:hypothetical protein